MSKASGTSTRRFWKIEGYDSTRLIFKMKKVLPVGCLTVKQMTSLLQRLASKHLDEDEIVASSIRRNCKGYAPLLECQLSSGPGVRYSIMVGSNPFYVGSVWKSDELAKRKK